MGREVRLSIHENHLINEDRDSVCYLADDITLYEYFQDITLEGAYFEEEQKESKEIIIRENYIKLRDEVAKNIFYFRMSRRATASLEENATFAFKAAEAFMKARNNA